VGPRSFQNAFQFPRPLGLRFVSVWTGKNYVRVLTSERPNMNKKEEQLETAFEYADEYVLSHTNCATIADISNGYCDVWAKAVWRKPKFVTIRERHGHTYIVFEGIAYDSDHGIGNGFEPD
jgi:hypothetical protein